MDASRPPVSELRHVISQFCSRCFWSVDNILVAWLNRLLGIYLSFFYFAGLYKHKVTLRGCVNYMLNGFVLESVSICVV